MKKRLPSWIKVKYNHSELHGMKSLLREYGVSTVCEEARCPNKAECFSKPTATFMILGSMCTRNCAFCAVDPVDSSAPYPLDSDEPRKVALAAERMKLKYIVITSVTRDDLDDGGAGHFALTVRAVRKSLPRSRIEVLTPDFKGDSKALSVVLEALPDVFNHNIETVPSLYSVIRPQADYHRSLRLLEEAKRTGKDTFIKSGIMLGLGETLGEVREVLRDLRNTGCDIVTIGQYMRPTKLNPPVAEYFSPEVFGQLRDEALDMGFRYVASSPLVRSSMNAEEMFNMEGAESV